MVRAAMVAAVLCVATGLCAAQITGYGAFVLDGRPGDLEWAADVQWPSLTGPVFDKTRARSGTWSLRRRVPLATGQIEPAFEIPKTFETAEWLFSAWVKLEDEGQMRIHYRGDGRNGIQVIDGPTDGWQQVRLHLRLNPEGDPHGLFPLCIGLDCVGTTEPITSWWDDIEITPLYQHQIPRVTRPPVIDGALSDACWDDAASIADSYWRMYNQPHDARMATEVWCCYDDENLYVAFRCETPDVRRLVSKITQRDAFAWRDDSAEIFFDPGHDHDRYYEFVINPDDVVFDSKWFFEGGNWLTDWNYIGEWKSGFADRAWAVEIRLALESYEERDLRGQPTGYMPLPTGDVAGILFSRNDMVLGEGMSHADCVGSFHEVDQYGHLVGFRPNRIEPYRRTALRELGRIEGAWQRVYADAGRPALPQEAFGHANELPDFLADLRRRIEAPAPSFDDWVAIRERIEYADEFLLPTARSLLAPHVAARRWPDAPWGLAVATAWEVVPVPLQSHERRLAVPEVVRISGARGESEGVQIVVLPRDGGTRVRVEPEPLAGPGGLLSDIRWYSVNWSGTPPLGDRLAPEEPVSAGGMWWEIEVPREARPGVYVGEIVTTDGRHRVTLPVELTVHDFALPQKRSLVLSASFDPQEVARLWYGERAPLSGGEYWLFARELLAHGLTPREMFADMTRWDESGAVSLSAAEGMAERARQMGARWSACTAARPESLAALPDPAGTLDRVLAHWERVLGERLIPVYVPAGGRVPAGLTERQLRSSVAVIEPWLRMEQTPPGAAIGLWAVWPETAVGLGGDIGSRGWEGGAELARLAGILQRTMVWRSDGRCGPTELRMLGWIADDYRVTRIFLDDDELGWLGRAQASSGLLYCLAGLGEEAPRLREPQPSLALKALRDAADDYEYLQMLRRLDRALGRHQVGDKLWRLRLANATAIDRNWDMVMNVHAHNQDEAHLMARREELARQIERTRAWLRRAGVEEGLPGDGLP
ncbi:MAG: sugar-binding protein [Armatimonadota bacterium]